MVWFCSKKTLFMKTGSELPLVCESQVADPFSDMKYLIEVTDISDVFQFIGILAYIIPNIRQDC